MNMNNPDYYAEIFPTLKTAFHCSLYQLIMYP